MRTRSNVAIDLLDMAELQTTREEYFLPDGVTGTDRLSYPLRHTGTAHAWLFTSLCRFSDIDELSNGLLLTQYKYSTSVFRRSWNRGDAKLFFMCV